MRKVLNLRAKKGGEESKEQADINQKLLKAVEEKQPLSVIKELVKKGALPAYH